MNCCLFFIPCVCAQPTAKEYEIKALFLYHFTNFVSWPHSAFTGDADPFRICLFGEDPFGKTIDLTVNNQQVDNHPLVVERINDISALRTCHILFIHPSEQVRLEEVLNAIKDYPILTVSEIEGFVTKGGMIEFIKLDNKVGMGINPNALNAVNLKARAQLLKLVKIIVP
jgi:hypothetical protein